MSKNRATNIRVVLIAGMIVLALVQAEIPWLLRILIIAFFFFQYV